MFSISLLLFFRENKILHCMRVICLSGDNLNEMSSLISCEKKKEKCFQLSTSLAYRVLMLKPLPNAPRSTAANIIDLCKAFLIRNK